MENYKSIDIYINSQPKTQQGLLNKIRALIKKLAPKAEETISYGMPTYKLNGKNLLHFAGYKKHIGFYPTPSAVEKFSKELSKYKTSKGAIQFPLDAKLPEVLINKIIKFRVVENTNKAKK